MAKAEIIGGWSTEVDNSKDLFHETHVEFRVPPHLTKYYVLFLDAALVEEARAAIAKNAVPTRALHVLRKILEASSLTP